MSKAPLGFYDHFLFLKFFHFLPDSINTFLFSAYCLPSTSLVILGDRKEASVKPFLIILPSAAATGWLELCLGSRVLDWVGEVWTADTHGKGLEVPPRASGWGAAGLPGRREQLGW